MARARNGTTIWAVEEEKNTPKREREREYLIITFFSDHASELWTRSLKYDLKMFVFWIQRF